MALSGRNEIWEQLKQHVNTDTISLFDVDLPTGPDGVLRVFITRNPDSVPSETVVSAESAGEEFSDAAESELTKRIPQVTVADCAAASKRISNAPEFDQLLHSCYLEVSSPGVNRRLRRPEHFSGALGERIKLKARDAEGKMVNCSGKLVSFDGSSLNIHSDADQTLLVFQLADVDKAQVDFLFQ